MEREWRYQGSGHGTAQQESSAIPGRRTLTEAFGASGEGHMGSPVRGNFATPLPRLDLRPSGAGLGGDPVGEPQAISEQRMAGGDGPAEGGDVEAAAATPEGAPAPGATPTSSPAGGPAATTPQPGATPSAASDPGATPTPARSPTAGGSGQGGTTAATAPTITHETLRHAPSGAPDTRTTVAVGEKVRFKSTAKGKWNAALHLTGTPGTYSGLTYIWTAPSTAGSAIIKFDPGGGAPTIDTTITVIAPSVEYRNAHAIAFPGQAPGIAGVQMETDVYYTPDTVSFANTYWWEQPGPASGATGYFVGMALPYHNPTKRDLPIDTSNTGIYDRAGFWNFPAPWSAGFFEWVIPTKYKVRGEATRHLITNVHQTCNIDATGTMTVQKGTSAAISRAP